MHTEHMTDLVEPYAVADTFVSGLAEVEELGGGCFRFVFYAVHRVEGREERQVVAKLIAPMDAVPPALMMAAKAIGFGFAKECCLRTRTH